MLAAAGFASANAGWSTPGNSPYQVRESQKRDHFATPKVGLQHTVLLALLPKKIHPAWYRHPTPVPDRISSRVSGSGREMRIVNQPRLSPRRAAPRKSRGLPPAQPAGFRSLSPLRFLEIRISEACKIRAILRRWLHAAQGN